MVTEDERCPIGREDAGGGVDHFHVWQWVYVPRMVSHFASSGDPPWQDIGGKLVGRCIYCGATWEEPSDGDD